MYHDASCNEVPKKACHQMPKDICLSVPLKNCQHVQEQTVTQENCHEKILDDKLVNEESSHVGAASLRIFPTDRCGPLEPREYFFLMDVN